MPSVTRINNRLTIHMRKYSEPEPVNSMGWFVNAGLSEAAAGNGFASSVGSMGIMVKV